jgi:hypothetical protein
MQKETLLLENIIKDLKIVRKFQKRNMLSWYAGYFTPPIVFAIILGVLLKSLWIGVLISSVSIYYIVLYIIESKNHRAAKDALLNVKKRGDISISVEKFEHTSIERIYEPNMRAGVLSNKLYSNLTQIAYFYNFSGGKRWRVPDVFYNPYHRGFPREDKHYRWSKDHYISTEGLANISLQGDEFFYISLQGYSDISYIYPCKMFVLEEMLK